MSRHSPAPSSLRGAASRKLLLAVSGIASALLLSWATAGSAAAQDEFPGPESPECTWAGERILSLLWRDDIRTASDFLDLYDRFDCPSEHIPLAFRCLVQVGVSPEQGDPGLPTRARACWAKPDLDPASLKPAAAPGEGGGQAEGEAAQQPPQGEQQQPPAQQPAAQ